MNRSTPRLTQIATEQAFYAAALNARRAHLARLRAGSCHLFADPAHRQAAEMALLRDALAREADEEQKLGLFLADAEKRANALHAPKLKRKTERMEYEPVPQPVRSLPDAQLGAAGIVLMLSTLARPHAKGRVNKPKCQLAAPHLLPQA